MSSPARKTKRRTQFHSKVRRRQKVKKARLKARREAMKRAKLLATQRPSPGAQVMQDEPNQAETTSQEAAPETINAPVTAPATILEPEAELEQNLAEEGIEHGDGEEAEGVQVTEQPTAIETTDQAPMQAGTEEAPAIQEPEGHSANG